jgi:hypothetical protein
VPFFEGGGHGCHEVPECVRTCRLACDSTALGAVIGARLMRWEPGVSYADSVVAVEASEYCLELLAQPWDVVGESSADDVEVGVGEYDSRSDDVAPAISGCACLVSSEILDAASPRIFDPPLCGGLNDGIGCQEFGTTGVLDEQVAHLDHVQ